MDLLAVDPNGIVLKSMPLSEISAVTSLPGLPRPVSDVVLLMPGYRKRLGWNEGVVLPTGVTAEARRATME
jgi:hypothetical protein